MRLFANRARFILLATACLGASTIAQATENWCRIENRTAQDYSAVIEDKVAVGKVFFRDNAKSPAIKLDSTAQSYTIKARSTVEFTTDTTASVMAITLRFGPVNQTRTFTDINFKKAAGSATQIKLKCEDFTTSPVTLKANAYKVEGKTFITLE